MAVKRGVAVWIMGFLTFLTVLSSFGIVVYWIREGRGFILRPYLIGDIIGSLVGDLSVENYFWISLTATFIFLFFKKVNTNLEDTKTETLAVLETQGKTIQKVHRDTVSTVETKVGETREEILGALKQQETTIREVGRLSKKGAAIVKKQRAELEDIKIRLEKIEGKLVPPQPRLKSQDNPEEIKGIGPRLGEELRTLGITNVGKLITVDPAVIYEKTRVSRDMAERLQATAQLLMIPGVDKNDAELLVDAGITSRRELADQDLVQLSRKIKEISKDKNPTIEEISSWIRRARQ